MTREELEKEYWILARRADGRLRLLEAMADEGYESAEKWAYQKAMRDIHKWSGEDARRFARKPPEDDRDLEKKIAEIKEFLTPGNTSTRTGIINVFKKKAESINEKYGTDFSWQQLGDFMEKNYFDKMQKSFGSQTLLYTIGNYMQNEDQMVKDIKEWTKDHFHMGDGVAVAENIYGYLQMQGIDISMEDAASIAAISNNEISMVDVIHAADALNVLPAELNAQELNNLRELADRRDVDWEDLLE